MTPTGQKLLQDALRLSEEERAELAGSLVDSLETAFDEDVLAAWDAEIAHRIAELNAGTVQTLSWPEARRMILGGADDAADA